LWSASFQLIDVAWVMSQRVSELLVSWRGQLGNRNALKIWKLAVWCLTCFVWREQNVKSFEDYENRLLELKKTMLQSFYTWRVAWNSFPVSSFSEFLEFCSSLFIHHGFSCILLVYSDFAHFCF
jgi:hypothetical protein